MNTDTSSARPGGHLPGIVGIDIGGANLKYAHLDGRNQSRFFPMWTDHARLTETMRVDLQSFGRIDALAVTMTGELADCFLDRRAGVKFIVDATCAAALEHGIADVHFYGVDGRFVRAEEAKRNVDRIAASNWHALGTYVARSLVPSGLLVDIGSTTTDIIPIEGGCVATEAETDFDRLAEGSLVYVGCRRTPVCGLVDSLPYRGRSIRVMNEWFATMDDARITVGIEPEQPDDTDSADRQPRTIAMSVNRLARMIGLDHRQVTLNDATGMAHQILDAAKSRITPSLESLDSGSGTIVISGHGSDLIDTEWLARRPERKVERLEQRLGAPLSRSAPSFAVANLLSHFQTTDCTGVSW